MTTKSRSRDLLPQPFDWIEIPGKGYSIAKYPVTNSQFKLFIDSGGYTNRQWWTEAGWEASGKGWEIQGLEFLEMGKAWSQPRYWTDTKWTGAEQPVVGVSWYEVVAYCLWLRDLTGEQIMLPTEDQWQYAAQGDDGRKYPWGNDWDCMRCNNSVSPCKSDQTTQVRMYEGKGDSHFGVVDMGGNVWEWCVIDNYSGMTNFERHTRRLFGIPAEGMLRGGSWVTSNHMVGFLCDYQFPVLPSDRSNDVGFRLAMSY